jgi:hypothetical protein
MPREGFEPTIPVFERAKTVHALDRAAAEAADPLRQKSFNGTCLYLLYSLNAKCYM